ncbi:hypothetical protein [Bradyrhizobium sp. USDA 4350]
MLAIMLLIGVAGAIVLLATYFVIGWISPTAAKRFARAVDVVGAFVLKLTVVAVAVGILAVVGLALAS